MDERDPGSDRADEATEARMRRAEERDSLFLHATLRRMDEDEPVTVRVRNLSSGGMMAELGTPFAPGDRLTVDMRGIGAVPGTVRWREAGRIGIAFDTVIDPQRARKAVVQRYAPPSGAATPGRPKRPKLFG